ncbi:MAG TPA: O-methyltransferase [Acidimicrobiales bacterium]
MNDELWNAIDDDLVRTFLPPDPALEAALADSDAAGLPRIAVSAALGKFLSLLVRATGARRVLEVGTLGGYSTIWMARGLPDDGHLVTLELNPTNAEVARKNLDRAGVGTQVEVKVGAAADTLASMVEAGTEPFDFVFLDADKEGYTTYLRQAMQLSRKGTVIVADNVVREGRILDPSPDDTMATGIREFLDAAGADPGVDGTAVQTVGTKGHDGFAFLIVD